MFPQFHVRVLCIVCLAIAAETFVSRHTRSLALHRKARISAFRATSSPQLHHQQQQQQHAGHVHERELIDLQRLKEVAEQAMLAMPEEQLRELLPRVNQRLLHASQIHEETMTMNLSGSWPAQEARTACIALEDLPPDVAVPYPNVARIVANFPDVHAGYVKVPSLFPKRKGATTTNAEATDASLTTTTTTTANQSDRAAAPPVVRSTIRNPFAALWRWMQQLVRR